MLFISVLACCQANAQAMFFSSATVPDSVVVINLEDDPLEPGADSLGVFDSVSDSLLSVFFAPDTVISLNPLPRSFFTPSVYGHYEFKDTASVFTPEYSGNPSLRWIEDANAQAARISLLRRNLALKYPDALQYNVGMLPEPIPEYEVVINPENHTVTINEAAPEIPVGATFEAATMRKRHWIRNFSASLQFSQAYVSPNWYQGGNNNVNSLLNLYYNVKLNQKYHPKLMFETTFQYRLGMNSAPGDSLRDYNVSEDIFQVDTRVGYQATQKWYYTITGMFKTQLVNAYATNSYKLRSAFLSPGELNLGLGMTYKTTNAKKTITFDASISPLAYGLKICTDDRMNAAAYGIKEGRHTESTYGSSTTLDLSWKVAYNILLRSHFYAFTDYDRFYADLENTLQFDVSRFLSTKIYVHMRYDTDTPVVPDQSWKKFQLREILSFGLSYKFSTI